MGSQNGKLDKATGENKGITAMGKLKGCTCEGCISAQKKKKYKEKDSYCINCGNALVLLCKKCRTPLAPEHEDALCSECAERAREKNEKTVKALGKAVLIGGSVAVVLTTAFPKLKQVSNITKKLKKK